MASLVQDCDLPESGPGQKARYASVGLCGWDGCRQNHNVTGRATRQFHETLHNIRRHRSATDDDQ
jgi:hypothetical protein